MDGLLIPGLLQVMIAAGRWPRTADEAAKQNLHARVPEDRNRRLRTIYLYAPPFHSVAEIVAGSGKDFYAKFGALHELVPEASVEIGDFGLGSDTPILLDYRAGPTDPQVIHLEWSGNGEASSWVVLAPNFAEFVDLLGL
ncbi:MAG: hypothetical protein C0467_17340 [Planctomycetaceae bacterium]|nr:hypothetical protein [Planctomycetaceae bacterium]